MELSELTLDIEVGRNMVAFYIFGIRYVIYADPGEKDTYELHLYKELENDECEDIVRISYPLTHDQWVIALDSSCEDFLFEDDIDSLMAKRVAKSILNYFLREINEDLYGRYTKHFCFEKISKKWEKYLLYLIHEKEEGRDISKYIMGFEPHNNTQENNEQ